MKFLFSLFCWALAASAQAESIVVFGKNQTRRLDDSAEQTPVSQPEHAAFLASVQTRFATSIDFSSALPLVAPPDWGRTVAGAAGSIEYPDSFFSGFLVRVALNGLTPNHRYVLTLNGNPKLAGNDRLPDPVPGLPAERYFDFLTVETDADGNYGATIAIALTPGPYDVRFYVKDTADFKIILYQDYFKFAVE